MVNAIALEASTDSCSVTLMDGEEIQTLTSERARSHAQALVPFVDRLLQASDCGKAGLDFIACGGGPGSFTGLRIGFSVAQGLAFGLGLPLITVSSLKTLALAGFKANPRKNVFITVLDARMGEVYWGAYQVDNNGFTALVADCLQDIELASSAVHLLLQHHAITTVQILGPGASLLNLSEQLVLCRSEAVVVPASHCVMELAMQMWCEGDYTSADRAKLSYLRNSVSWNKRKRIRQ